MHFFKLKKLLIGFLFYLPLLFWIGLIFASSAQSIPESAELSGNTIHTALSIMMPGFNNMEAGAQFNIIESLQNFVRKTAHFLAYMILAWFCLLAIWQHRFKISMQIKITMIFCFLYASSDEIHQIFSHRGSKFSDVILDTCGSLTGVVIYMLIRKRVLKLK